MKDTAMRQAWSSSDSSALAPHLWGHCGIAGSDFLATLVRLSGYVQVSSGTCDTIVEYTVCARFYLR